MEPSGNAAEAPAHGQYPPGPAGSANRLHEVEASMLGEELENGPEESVEVLDEGKTDQRHDGFERAESGSGKGVERRIDPGHSGRVLAAGPGPDIAGAVEHRH